MNRARMARFSSARAKARAFAKEALADNQFDASTSSDVQSSTFDGVAPCQQSM
jgi:hypothetical protein